jgi:aryl-alcohol dehydrogenase-like predicted oxidoreductase
MSPFTPYTFGSMSLSRNPADIRNDLVVVRRAMEAGVWFHSSPTYNMGFTYMVLRAAFEEDRSRVPRLILKVRDGSVPLMRFEVEDSCRRLGIDGIDVAQLVSMDPNPGNLVDQLRAGNGELVDELASLRERGLIRQAVLFLTPENSEAAVEASGHELIDGVTLYWNVVQRDCAASAWAAIREQNIPVLALRTVGGGPIDKATAARDAEISALLEEAGCRSRTELALRHAASEPVVQTTIGGTSSLGHLEEFLEASKAATPLPEPILRRIESVQRSL